MTGRPLVLAVAVVVSLACAGVAVAALSVVNGPTTATTPTLTLNGLDQQSSFVDSIGVEGATTAGWNLTGWAPAPTSGTHALGVLVVTAQPTSLGCTQTCPTPTGITWPVTLGTSAGAAAKIYNAPTGNRSDIVGLSVTFGVNVPANAYRGSYTTTIALAVSSGP